MNNKSAFWWLVAFGLFGMPSVSAAGVSEYGGVDGILAGAYWHAMPDESDPLLRQEMGVTDAVRPVLTEAKTAYKAEQWARVITLIEPLLEKSPSVMPAWGLLGDAYWMSGRPEEAMKLWHRLCVIRPDYAPVFGWMGRAELVRGNVKAAREAFQRGLEIGGLQGVERLNFARVLRESGDHQGAVDLLRPMIQEDSGRIAVVMEMASALLSKRDYAASLPYWQKLRKADPTNLVIRIRAATALLHTGQTAEALTLAKGVLEDDPMDVYALGIMADHAQFGTDRPEDALPWLKKMRDASGSPVRRQQLAMRFIWLYLWLNQHDPERFPAAAVVELLKEVVAHDLLDAEVRLTLGEVLDMAGQRAEAREQYKWVLSHHNPKNFRARRDLFELALEEGKFEEASSHLELMTMFNPRDIFLHYYRARWYEAQGELGKALGELDNLEAKGRLGSVAVLLYHGLSASDQTAVLPSKLFREHMTALKDAGFRFLTADQLAARLAGAAKARQIDRDIRLPREVCVTFDDARRDAMYYGTQVGQELKLVFSMHIPVGYVLMNHPFICNWDQLREYQKAKCWVFGGHTLAAHEQVPIDAEMNEAFALPNQQWLAAEGRLETGAEYEQRLDREYGECRQHIVQELGGSNTCNFFAYPFGDVGQLTRSNDPDAIRKNLEHGRRFFSTGFIQSIFGYATADDNPMLYQRREPERLASGAELVQQTLENHPVNLARRMRVDIAARQGKRYLAVELLRALAKDGYPPKALQRARASVERRIGRPISFPELDSVPNVLPPTVRPPKEAESRLIKLQKASR